MTKRAILTIHVMIILSGLTAAGSTAWAGGWIPLFDGLTLNGWTTQAGHPVTKGWRAAGGVLHLDPQSERGGNIITQANFCDFELVFEWKISPGGNSGIKYRVKDFDGRMLGCEYQMIDDHQMPRLRPIHKTGSLYDVFESHERGQLRPAGEYNRGRILVCGRRIEHWLNGRRVVSACVGSPQWRQQIASSKFSDVDGFGENRVGKIMLTDHNSEVWFRNVFIRDLSAPRRTTFSRRVGLFRRR